jgi:hypothetical protein
MRISLKARRGGLCHIKPGIGQKEGSESAFSRGEHPSSTVSEKQVDELGILYGRDNAARWSDHPQHG